MRWEKLETYEVFGAVCEITEEERAESLKKYQNLERDDYGNIIADDETDYEPE